MLLDASIVLAYFVVILAIGVWSRTKGSVTAEEYFLSSRSLKWPSIAISTIATNISASHFLGMAGSAYIFGLGQANFELNAIFGLLVATFIFVPLYLRNRVTTISQFFESRFGPRVALTYSVLMMWLFAFLYLGKVLFWGSYAIDALFADLLWFLGDDRAIRLGLLVMALGAFSAFYTWLGGMTAVVRTDMAQFVLLLGGGILTLGFSMKALGGPAQLYEQTGHLMHLHLPADHPELPWIGILGMLLLNLNYWGANQVILQRALAAESLRHAQVGLLVGGVLKYVMVLIIIIPAIALAGITQGGLASPDQAYPVLVETLLPAGVRGIILCGLFASLMSSADSIFNSVSTLWSVDVYKRWLRPDADDDAIVRSGRRAILVTFVTGVSFGFLLIYVKLSAEQLAITHWQNALSYVVKNAFVVLVVAAMFLLKPSPKLVLGAMLLTLPLTGGAKWLWPELNYLVRTTGVILLGIAAVAVPTWMRDGFGVRWRVETSGPGVTRFGVALAASLVLSHIIFH